MGCLHDFKNSLAPFSAAERRNMLFYISGIMIYKFGLEAFSGSLTALATNRYDFDAMQAGVPSKAFERLGLLQGLNQACQCIGSILIAPLIKRFPTKSVLTVAVIFYALSTTLLLVVDAVTGGQFMPKKYQGVGNHPADDFYYYGRYDTDGMIPICCFCGICYGMVELIRRVIPRDIVGGNVQKLRKMDAMVHIFYEIAGTAGAFCTGLVLIPKLGNNRSFIVTPICFAISAALWYQVSDLGFKREHEKEEEKVLAGKPRFVRAVVGGFYLFGESVYLGAKILFSSRKFIWLLPSYGVALYAHRYLENGIATQVSRRYLGDSSWSQIMTGGSNFGELLGALFVFICTNFIKTPMPWLRLDALFLLSVWYFPFWNPPQRQVSQAWIAAATLVPIGFGWAAGDVSLAAYIQASLGRIESASPRVSALGATMSFIYSLYVITYATLGTVFGRYLDGVYRNTGSISKGLFYTAGVQFTIISTLIFASTMIPRGALSLNPSMLENESLEDEEAPEDALIGNEGTTVAEMLDVPMKEQAEEDQVESARV